MSDVTVRTTEASESTETQSLVCRSDNGKNGAIHQAQEIASNRRCRLRVGEDPFRA